METPSPESIPIVLGQEDDGRWWADVESMPGVMAYGPTREAAIAAVGAGSASYRRLHRSRRGRPAAVRKGLLRRISRWPSVKAKRLLAALIRIGWTIAWQTDPIAASDGRAGPTTHSPFMIVRKSARTARTDCKKDRLASRGPVSTLGLAPRVAKLRVDDDLSTLRCGPECVYHPLATSTGVSMRERLAD